MLKKPDHQKYKSIGKFLKDYRLYLQEKHGDKFSQVAVCKNFGYGNGQFLSNIERELHLPPVDFVAGLFEYYNIDREIAYKLMLKERERELRQVLLRTK